jgi:hypothetical protein
MKPCKLCGVETNGSIGAAGIQWTSICQPCKDKEDKAALEQVKIQARILNVVFQKLLGDK